ncbi:MAG: hypothetical protein J7M05_09240 [Anaerolineae bacterium]|nr:hypothetical protein [Anaerolineae bacterium]
MDYGRILRRSLEITWKHKVLWIFGIAAALFSGHVGGPRISRSIQYSFGGGKPEFWGFHRIRPPFGPWGHPPRGMMPPSMAEALPFLVSLVLLAALLILIATVVSIVIRYTSLGALVGMVNETEEKGTTSFRSGLDQGGKRLLPLFAIDLLIGLGTGVLIVVMLLVLFTLGAVVAVPAGLLISAGGNLRIPGIILAVGVGLGLFFLLILLTVALSALVTILRELAFRTCVIEQKGVFASIEEGWKLMRSHSREVFLTWLLLVVINLALGLALMPFALIGIGSLVGPAFATFHLTKMIWPAVLVALPIALGIFAIGILLSGIYLVFRSAVWTLTYRELQRLALLDSA